MQLPKKKMGVLVVPLDDYEEKYLEGIARANNLSSAEVVCWLIHDFLDSAAACEEALHEAGVEKRRE